MVDDVASSSLGTVGGAQSKRASGGRSNKSGQLDDRVQAYIGRELKVIYDTIVNEDVPESLLDLLGQVDKPAPDDNPKKR